MPTKSSTRLDDQNVVNMSICQVNLGVLSHNLRDRIEDTASFAKIQEIPEVLMRKVWNNFQDDANSVMK